jgi:hypothetical protein
MLVRMKSGGFIAPDEKFREGGEAGSAQREAQIWIGVLVSPITWQISDERRYPTMTDIFEVIGPLFRKLTETCIAHQIAETGSATLLVESDKYMARYRFTLEPQ